MPRKKSASSEHEEMVRSAAIASAPAFERAFEEAEPIEKKQKKVPGTGSITEFEGADGARYRRIHVQKGPGRRAPWTDKTERIG